MVKKWDRTEYDHKLYKKKYLENPHIYSKRSRLWGQKVKEEVLSHYNKGKLQCFACDENRLECLSIDHIEGGGTKQRKELGITGSYQFYVWLRRQNYPEGYQVLCMNCQFVKRFRNYEERRV